MKWVAGMLGAIAGFAIGVFFTEIVFSNDASWPDVVPFALALIGVLVAVSLVDRRRSTEFRGHRGR